MAPINFPIERLNEFLNDHSFVIQDPFGDGLNEKMNLNKITYLDLRSSSKRLLLADLTFSMFSYSIIFVSSLLKITFVSRMKVNEKINPLIIASS